MCRGEARTGGAVCSGWLAEKESFDRPVRRQDWDGMDGNHWPAEFAGAPAKTTAGRGPCRCLLLGCWDPSLLEGQSREHSANDVPACCWWLAGGL